MIAFVRPYDSLDATAKACVRIRTVLSEFADNAGRIHGVDPSILEEAAARVLWFVVRDNPSWKKTHWRVLSVLASLARIVVCDDDDKSLQEILHEYTRLNLETLLIMSYSKSPLTSHGEVNSDANVEVIEQAVRKIENAGNG